jgi:hypothetical protein
MLFRAVHAKYPGTNNLSATNFKALTVEMLSRGSLLSKLKHFFS